MQAERSLLDEDNFPSPTKYWRRNWSMTVSWLLQPSCLICRIYQKTGWAWNLLSSFWMWWRATVHWLTSICPVGCCIRWSFSCRTCVVFSVKKNLTVFAYKTANPFIVLLTEQGRWHSLLYVLFLVFCYHSNLSFSNSFESYVFKNHPKYFYAFCRKFL